MTGNESIVTRF